MCALKDTASQFSSISWVRDRVVAKHLQGTRWAGGGVQLLFTGGNFRTEPTRDPPLPSLPWDNSVPLRASRGTVSSQLGAATSCAALVPPTLQAIAIGAGAGGRWGGLGSHDRRKRTLLFHRWDHVGWWEGENPRGTATVGGEASGGGHCWTWWHNWREERPPKRHSLVLNNNRLQEQENYSWMLSGFLGLNWVFKMQACYVGSSVFKRRYPQTIIFYLLQQISLVHVFTIRLLSKFLFMTVKLTTIFRKHCQFPLLSNNNKKKRTKSDIPYFHSLSCLETA